MKSKLTVLAFFMSLIFFVSLLNLMCRKCLSTDVPEEIFAPAVPGPFAVEPKGENDKDSLKITETSQEIAEQKVAVSCQKLHEVLENLSKGDFSDYSYAQVLKIIQSDIQPDSEYAQNDISFFKILLIPYLGVLESEKAIILYEGLLEDDGLGAFVDDCKLAEVSKGKPEKAKQYVVTSIIDGYCYMNSDDGRTRLEEFLRHPLKFKSKENCHLNKIFESAVISALAQNDQIRKIGLKEYLTRQSGLTVDTSLFDEMNRYKAIADEIKEDFSCE